MSILFNGDAYLESQVTDFPVVQNNKTVCLQCYATSLTGVQGILNVVNNTLGIGYQLGIRNNQFVVWGHGGGIYIQTALSINVWTHIAYVYEAPYNRIYINGELAAENTTVVQQGQPDICQIGGNQWNESLVNMTLEDIRIYNRVLGQNELLTIKNSGHADAIVHGLLAHWPCIQHGTIDQTNFNEVRSNRACSKIGTAAIQGIPSTMLKKRRYS